MRIEIHSRVAPALFCTAPSSFEEQTAGRMSYITEGEKIVVPKSSLEAAEEDFKQTDLYQALHKAFKSHPNIVELVLEAPKPKPKREKIQSLSAARRSSKETVVMADTLSLIA